MFRADASRPSLPPNFHVTPLSDSSKKDSALPVKNEGETENPFQKPKKFNALETLGIKKTIEELSKEFKTNPIPETRAKLAEARLVEMGSCYQYKKEQLEEEKQKVVEEQGKNKQLLVNSAGLMQQLNEMRKMYDQVLGQKRKQDEEYQLLERRYEEGNQCCLRLKEQLHLIQTQFQTAETRAGYWQPRALNFEKQLQEEKVLRASLEREWKEQKTQLELKFNKELAAQAQREKNNHQVLEHQLATLQKEMTTQETSLKDERVKRQKVEESKSDLVRELDERHKQLEQQQKCLTDIQHALHILPFDALLNQDGPPLTVSQDIKPVISSNQGFEPSVPSEAARQNAD